MRFLGNDGKRELVNAFLAHPMALGSRDVAVKLADVCELCVVESGCCLIEQDGADRDLFLILVGDFWIERNRRRITTRGAGQHLGELALVDLHSLRSATVRACQQSVVARISESAFSAVAEQHPQLWRKLAIEMSRRHRQRLETVPIRNERPCIFVGSSSEAMSVAEAVATGIHRDWNEVRLWTKGVFGPGDTYIEALEKAVRSMDFAILVVSHDDLVTSRGSRQYAPRDNVIFELGLFMGALGRDRVVALKPAPRPARWLSRMGFPFCAHHSDVKMPSDLLGVSTATYREGTANTLHERLKTACSDVVERFNIMGPK